MIYQQRIHLCTQDLEYRWSMIRLQIEIMYFASLVTNFCEIVNLEILCSSNQPPNCNEHTAT